MVRLAGGIVCLFALAEQLSVGGSIWKIENILIVDGHWQWLRGRVLLLLSSPEGCSLIGLME